MPPLTRAFFARDSVSVARDLIGARLLIAEPDSPRLEGVIVETEAYSPNDQASHAFRGRTPRNAAMFGPAGHAYVYFIYGMHFCLNVVTEDDGIGAAVLLRALRPVAGLETLRRNRGASRPLPDAALCRGPGNLCRALGIDRTWNGRDLCASGAPLRIFGPSETMAIGASRRIGVSGDARARDAPWRFFALGEAAVSGSHLKKMGARSRSPREARGS
jgi:DNA-3-methyladenine glycosylase